MNKEPLVLFDGVCNFCAGVVQFMLRQDVHQRFYYAALQSPAGQRILQQYGLPLTGFNSFVLISEGKLYQQSSAALKLVPYLPWWWQWARVFWLVPRSLRDGVYRLIARNRYRWFGKKETCMIPGPEIKSRFLE